MLEQLRTSKTSEYLPVLVLTADVNPETRLRALSAGANDFLTKPVEPTEVGLRVRHLLTTRFMTLELQDQTEVLEQKIRARTWELEEAQIEILSEVDKFLTGNPKMLIGGFSAYSRIKDWKRMREIADKVGAFFWVDMAHVAGLVAARLGAPPRTRGRGTDNETRQACAELPYRVSRPRLRPRTCSSGSRGQGPPRFFSRGDALVPGAHPGAPGGGR